MTPSSKLAGVAFGGALLLSASVEVLADGGGGGGNIDRKSVV